MSEQEEVMQLPQELQVLKAQNIGLESQKADEHLAAFSPYVTELTTLSEKMAGINFDQPTAIDSGIASSIRKAMVKVRTGAEKEKDFRKKNLLTEGNLIQAAYNVIKNACELKEESLAKVEKYQELIQKAALEQLTNERMEQLSAYECFTDRNLIGQMTAETFEQFLTGAKATYNQKKEDERKAEEARLEAMRISTLREERMKAVRTVAMFLTDDEANEDFGKMSDEAWAALLGVIRERKNAEEQRQAEISKQLQEEMKAKAEAEEALRKEREEAQRKESEARAEIERLEQEKKAKAEAEAKAEEERLKQLAAEEKARKAAERKAKNAPDVDKLRLYLAFLPLSDHKPSLKSDEAKALMSELENDLGSLIASYEEKINQL
jgi:hypothetical protein